MSDVQSRDTWRGKSYGEDVAAFSEGTEPGWVKLTPGTPAYRIGARWYVRCMSGATVGRLTEGTHTVTEHDDGTITVEPSLVMSNGWHGWLRRGIFTMLEAETRA